LRFLQVGRWPTRCVIDVMAHGLTAQDTKSFS
jgi:hypothetical protein